MTSDRQKDIFFEALDLEAGARSDFLDAQCNDDIALRQRIDALLQVHEAAGDFMGAPTVGSLSPRLGSSAEAEHELGAEIGPYTLESLLGEGGFGRVFLARQREPVDRLVALKVLKAGMDSRAIVARFEAERQALAVMEHPSIASVLDGGQTPGGRPYFVMEYVRGEPISTFCERNDLSTRQRLQLFEQVCLAVQHAHHKGIVHRDLKPTNVLVTRVNDQPVPKVIDFGIAKAIGSQTSDKSPVTLEGHLIGTPAYMSPEQVTNAASMDSRSDVYTLGVLLYEILTGTPPFESTRFEETPLASLAQIICEETPPKPSTRVLSSAQMAKEGRTPVLPRRLAAQLRGDIDWIIMKAMEKDPSRRYQTAFAMATDIGRYLRDEAVDAGPPSRLYRLRKFSQRNRGELAAAVLILVALVGGLVSSLIFSARADRQQRLTALELEKSEAFAGFAADMLSGIDPAVARGKDTALLLQVLEDAEERLRTTPPEFVEVEVELHELLGTAFYTVADFGKAEAHFSGAVAQSREVFGETHSTTLRLREILGQIYVETSRFEEGRRELTAVFNARNEAFGPDARLTLDARFDLGVIERLQGDYERASITFEQVLEKRIAVLGNDHKDTMSARNSLATTLDDIGETERSVELFREVIAYQVVALGPDHPHTLATQNNLADSLGHLGLHEEAVEILVSVLETKRSVLGPDHPSLIAALNNVGSMYIDLDRSEEAEPLLREAVEISGRTLGPRDLRTLILTNNLAKLLLRSGRAEKAHELLAPSILIAEEVLGLDHPLVLAMLSHSVGIDLALDEPVRAATTAEELVARIDRAKPADHPDRASRRRLWATALLAAEDAAHSERVLREAFEMYERGMVHDEEDRSKTIALLVRACEMLGNADDAERWRELLPSPGVP